MPTLSEVEIEALVLSLQVAFWAITCSLPLGIATAWVLARCEFPGKSVVDVIIHLPLVVPPVVVGYLLLLLLGRRGPLGAWLHDVFGITVAFTWKGAAIAAAVMAFPLVVRAIRLSIEAVDQRLESTARTLGAGPVGVFFTVTLPLAGSGIVAGAILGFARSLGEFGATITFVSNIPGETQTLPIALYAFTQLPNGEEAAFRLVLISVALAFAALIASEFLARRLRARIAGEL
ncbi:MAG: molybdate ABC transporter permease subunit [Alphaproteobacteria bacterium]